jgi:phosphonate degradation associated HDIG domain protein
MKQIECLFSKWGNLQYAGEGVNQLEHALQTATLAQEANASNALITAALLHDLGHLLNRQGETPSAQGIDDRHQHYAANFLKDFFPQSVTKPIGLHVEAKRALCALKDQYYDQLSEDSKRSLLLQGGVFNSEQLSAFMAKPFAEDALRLRCWDDLAKVKDKKTSDLNAFLNIARTVLR